MLGALKGLAEVLARHDVDLLLIDVGAARITPIGHVLGRSHLDEVPQLIHVLRGEMSVVGPRPEQPEFVARLERTLPHYDRRHLIKPGLTGWAQVRCGYAAPTRARR